MELKLLIVEDHSSMIEGYKTLLEYIDEIKFDVDTAQSCEEGYQKISDFDVQYDLFIIDLLLPPLKERGIFSGGDLATLVRELRKSAKIIIVTSHVERLVLYSTLKKINPEGFLVKSDFSSEDFIQAIREISKGGQFSSSSVNDAKTFFSQHIQYLDLYNRQILYLLGKGVKTKSLPLHLSLSLSAIDKRKAQIKLYFGIEKGNDEDIIFEARKRNLI